MADNALLKTPLTESHRQLGARLIDFGGWEMPVQYPSGTIKEHHQVRNAGGLFDVCHMGEARLRGPGAFATIQRLVTNDVSKLVDGKALYTLMCYPNGGIVDDCIVYRVNEQEYFVVLNASNREKDLAWIREHVTEGCEVIDESDSTGLIAVQGPRAVELVNSLSPADLAAVPVFGFALAEIAGVPCMAARTGYTGEDGFELACPADQTLALWNALLEAGAPLGVGPIGLGARDTLRLEAKLSLYGNDIDENTTPLEAQLGWAVKLEGDDFIGRDALLEQKHQGVRRKLVGFKLEGRGIARHGYAVVDRSLGESDQAIGTVTSGTTGITVGYPIGLAYVPTELATPGTQITIDCRGKDVAATIVKGKFYQREA